ncbi:MAG: hypothetical protein ABIR08_10810 [Sphingomonas sp.]
MMIVDDQRRPQDVPQASRQPGDHAYQDRQPNDVERDQRHRRDVEFERQHDRRGGKRAQPDRQYARGLRIDVPQPHQYLGGREIVGDAARIRRRGGRRSASLIRIGRHIVCPLGPESWVRQRERSNGVVSEMARCRALRKCRRRVATDRSHAYLRSSHTIGTEVELTPC